MSAIDLVLMTHTHECNHALLDGKKCICGRNAAADELSELRAKIQELQTTEEDYVFQMRQALKNITAAYKDLRTEYETHNNPTPWDTEVYREAKKFIGVEIK